MAGCAGRWGYGAAGYVSLFVGVGAGPPREKDFVRLL